MRKHTWTFLLFILLSGGCKSVQHISNADVKYQVIKTDPSSQPDEKITELVAPYKLQLDAVMNEVLGTVTTDLTKQRPESTLGNWVADALLESLKNDGFEVDFSIVNYGGLRVPSITAGPLTRGELYELSPFDNMIMIVDIPGNVLDTIFQMIATTEGWPVSKGVNMVISNKMLVSAMVFKEAIDPQRIYKVATLDYIANGGDDMKPLISLSRRQTDKILRDLLIDYVRKATTAGSEITSSLDGRIIIK